MFRTLLYDSQLCPILLTFSKTHLTPVEHKPVPNVGNFLLVSYTEKLKICYRKVIGKETACTVARYFASILPLYISPTKFVPAGHGLVLLPWGPLSLFYVWLLGTLLIFFVREPLDLELSSVVWL